MWHEPLQLSRKFAQKYILTVLNVFKPSVFGAPVRGTIEKFEQGNKKPSEVGLVAQKLCFLAVTEDLSSPQIMYHFSIEFLELAVLVRAGRLALHGEPHGAFD